MMEEKERDLIFPRILNQEALYWQSQPWDKIRWPGKQVGEGT